MRTNANDTGAYIRSFDALKTSWQAFWNQVSSAGEGKDCAFDAVNILFKMFIYILYLLY